MQLPGLVIVGEYDKDLTIFAAELGGVLLLVAATPADQSNTLVPLPVGVRISLTRAEGELLAAGNGLSVFAFRYQTLGGRLLVTTADNGQVSAAWQAGAA